MQNRCVLSKRHKRVLKLKITKAVVRRRGKLFHRRRKVYRIFPLLFTTRECVVGNMFGHCRICPYSALNSESLDLRKFVFWITMFRSRSWDTIIQGRSGGVADWVKKQPGIRSLRGPVPSPATPSLPLLSRVFPSSFSPPFTEPVVAY